ncbi:uncharacterized protein LOC123561538 isoform X2 [Mercenaria mercenaria]|uniref:uncharacterized protein LOC123561538 isoform X2 n=2 Tax=Mercenaria mercenaria TaxID=6596 RepID=UPI00234E6090|nr:uncharacterized protein LOC123561538 isoform X2 [Mercenaria mercenaria]
MDKFYMFQMMKSDPDICVCNPITDNYTTFEILIQTNNPAFTLRQSRTRRRYNDFCWLRKILKKHHPLSCECPVLPEKKKFSERFEIQFLVQRMKELEDWLQRVVAVSLYLSDTTLHLFLQTSLTCQQIEAYINGKLSDSEVKRGYKEAELHLDENISSTALEVNKQDEAGGASGLSSSVSLEVNQSSPVAIRSRSPAVLHNMQERSDSGIAEFDSDTESSYDSQGSPYVRSLDSGMISDKYPPLTEVSQDLSNRNSNNGSDKLVSGLVESSSDSDKMLQRKQNTCEGIDEVSAFKVETVFNPNVFSTDVEINVCSGEKCKISGNERTLEHDLDRTSQGAINEVVSNRSDNIEDKEDLRNTESCVKPKQMSQRVQMGVLFR